MRGIHSAVTLCQSRSATSRNTRNSCDAAGVQFPREFPQMSLPGPASSGLRRSLRRRHMQMIALGGVIGAGLFVGSRVVIGAAGPAAVISFALTGTLVVLVMRMLGEMAIAYP